MTKGKLALMVLALAALGAAWWFRYALAHPPPLVAPVKSSGPTGTPH